MADQKIKPTVKSKSNYQYETFDIGNKAILLDDSKHEDVFAAIDELGLKGQKQLIASQDNKIIPFPRMNVTEQRAWKVYCPQADRLEDYSATQIPYEVITMLQLVKQQGYFDIDTEEEETKVKGHIEVWSEAREDIDPLIVGVIETSKKYSWGWGSPDKEYYPIARWGISLRPFEQILEVAKTRWVNERKARLAADIRKAKLAYENVQDDANKHFGGQIVSDTVIEEPINIDNILF